MATPTWKNVSAPGLTGVGALMTGANKLAQSAYKGISDAFTSGGQILQDREDRGIAEEQRAFDRVDDLLKRNLTNQEIAKSLYDAGNQEAKFKLDQKVKNAQIQNSIANASAANARTNLNNQTFGTNKKAAKDLGTLDAAMNSGKYTNADGSTDVSRMLKETGASGENFNIWQQTRQSYTGEAAAKAEAARQKILRQAAATEELKQRRLDAEGGVGEFDSTTRINRSQVQNELENLYPNNPEKVLEEMQKGEGTAYFGGRTFNAETVRNNMKKANKKREKNSLKYAPINTKDIQNLLKY